MSTLAPVSISHHHRSLVDVDAIVERLVEAFDASGDHAYKNKVAARVEALVKRRAVLAAAVEFELALLSLKRGEES